MEQAHIEKIKSYYDRQGEYQINDRYSGEQGIVYTKAGDNAHWLVVEQKGENGAEVRQTDADGRIIARDTYESIRNTVQCKKVRRKKAEGRGMAEFDPDEMNLLHQLGKDSKREVIDMLRKIETKVSDELIKECIGSMIHKLSALSEESCSELISSTKNRKQAERDCSVRKRLADAQRRLKNPTASRDKSKHVKRGNIYL